MFPLLTAVGWAGRGAAVGKTADKPATKPELASQLGPADAGGSVADGLVHSPDVVQGAIGIDGVGGEEC